MKRIIRLVACLCVSTFLFSSCIVSKKKFDAETARANREHDNAVALANKLATLTEQNNKLNGTIKEQTASIKDLNGRNIDLNHKVEALQDSISTLEDDINELITKLSTIGNEKENAAKELSSKQKEIAEQRKRLEQLQSMIDQQQKATEALRKKIADALTGFNSNELTVTQKNGKVYISMQEGLLFPSGSAEVNPKGKEALSKVAEVLNGNSDINIDIEGHTDSLPIHNKTFADNWALSTARSTSIAHVLIDDYNVNPTKLIASGRSQFDPVAPNSTPEGRGKNRRTEIILEPKLDELMSLLNGGKK